MVRSVRAALSNFCPQATKLSKFFEKISLIALSNESSFLELKLAQRKVIINFRGQLIKEGATKDDAGRFYGFGFTTLVIVSPFGTSFEYSSVDKDPTSMNEYTTFKTKSNSVFRQFQNRRPRFFDRKLLIRSLLVHFIHSCDASILQQLVKWFHTKYPKDTIATVHGDSFGANYGLINETSLQVKHCYYQLGFDNPQNLVYRCVIKPNFDRSPKSGKKSFSDLAPLAIRALSKEYSDSFPKENSILVKYKNSVLNSCY